LLRKLTRGNVREIAPDALLKLIVCERRIEVHYILEGGGAHDAPPSPAPASLVRPAETERWLVVSSEAGRKRARYQEMAVEGLIEFEELRARLAALEDTRSTAERELRALEARTEHLGNWSGIETGCWKPTLVSCPKRLTLCNQKNATGCIE